MDEHRTRSSRPIWGDHTTPAPAQPAVTRTDLPVLHAMRDDLPLNAFERRLVDRLIATAEGPRLTVTKADLERAVVRAAAEANEPSGAWSAALEIAQEHWPRIIRAAFEAAGIEVKP